MYAGVHTIRSGFKWGIGAVDLESCIASFLHIKIATFLMLENLIFDEAFPVPTL